MRKIWASKILILILAVATLIRVWQLTSIPNGFHRDEALFGYEAYSVARTGRDQHGRFLPLSFEGFGVVDYPLVIYARVPFAALFGLDIFTVRFSLVFYSIVTLFLIYKLTQGFFKDDKLALTAAVVGAFSTWHFFMSRSGYGIAIIGLVFLLLGAHLLLHARRRWQSVVGGISLGLTCFCYASYYFFLPLFLLAVLIFFFAELKKDKNMRLGFIFAVLVMILAFGLYWDLNLRRAPQSAFYLDKTNIEYSWADQPVGQFFALGGKYDFLERRLHDPKLAYLNRAALNYFSGFSNRFWLETGRGFESNVLGFGNLLLYEPILIMIGALYLVWHRSRAGLFLIAWIIIGPISSTFTKDVVSTRLLHMVVPFVILEAVALKYLVWELLARLKPQAVAVICVFIFLAPIVFLNVLYYDAYFRHMSAYSGRWWQKGFLDVVDLTNKYPEKQVYFKGKWDFAYIHFAFRNKYDPATFQKEAKREIGPYNFNTVTDFGRYHFVDTELWKKEVVCRDFNSIYIERLDENEKLTFAPDGEIKSLGSDTFVYYVPSAEGCAV